MDAKFLIDTNVLILSLYPDSSVFSFFMQALEKGMVVISVLTIAECLAGADKEDKEKFEVIFSKAIRIDVNETIAREAAKFRKKSLKTSKAYLVDCCLAATAKIYGYTLVTNNTRDFHFPGLRVFTP